MDPALLSRFVAGDESAFDALYALFARDVWRIVRRFFSSVWEQEEAFQEIWLDLYRKRDRFDCGRAEDFPAWLRTVARNRCLDMLDAARIRTPSALGTDASEEPGCAVAPESETGLPAAIRKALDRLLETLDAEERSVFTLCFVEERSHEEVARLLGITERRSKYLKKKLLLMLESDEQLRSLVG